MGKDAEEVANEGQHVTPTWARTPEDDTAQYLEGDHITQWFSATQVARHLCPVSFDWNLFFFLFFSPLLCSNVDDAHL